MPDHKRAATGETEAEGLEKALDEGAAVLEDLGPVRSDDDDGAADVRTAAAKAAVDQVNDALASAPSLPKAKSGHVWIVMKARRGWSIGESIGLSQGYTFQPGVAQEVTAADAAILLAGQFDGRTFTRAD